MTTTRVWLFYFAYSCSFRCSISTSNSKYNNSDVEQLCKYNNEKDIFFLFRKHEIENNVFPFHITDLLPWLIDISKMQNLLLKFKCHQIYEFPHQIYQAMIQKTNKILGTNEMYKLKRKTFKNIINLNTFIINQWYQK